MILEMFSGEIMQSESIANLAKALSIVQGKLTYAKKDSANPFFKSKYADLESVWDACRDLLSANGLSVIQLPGKTYFETLEKHGEIMVYTYMSLTTIIAHSSGEWISQEMSVPMSKIDAQGAGSCISYMRRYALASVVGVVQADDDGNAASAPKQVKSSSTMKSVAEDIL
jgi:ERF superfamily